MSTHIEDRYKELLGDKILDYWGKHDLYCDALNSLIEELKLLKSLKLRIKFGNELLLEINGPDNTFDEESGHGYVDEILLAIINNEELSNSYNAIDKWYA